MIRVLYDHQAFEMQRFGGISYYYAKIIDGLNSTVDATIAVHSSGNEYLERLKNSLTSSVRNTGFIEDFMFGMNFPGKNRMYSLRNSLFPSFSAAVKNVKESLKALDCGGFDLFHPTYYDPYFLKNIRNIPYVITAHDCTHEQYPELFGAADRTFHNKKLVFKNATRIISISESTKKDIIKFYDIPESRIDVVYQGIEKYIYLDEESVSSIRLPEQYILYTGQRYHYKNWLFFVRAVTDILLSYKNLTLVCTGPAFTNSEKEYLIDLGLKDKVIHIRPRFEDLSVIYSKALAFVFPSLSEGFGLPILESMSVGCPTLLSDIPIMHEIGADAALYFLPKDMDSIRVKVSSIIEDRELRASLSAKGKIRALDFSWESTCLKTLDVYNKAIIGK
jgi:glycosyltransferase involved in cell wall biosynthesis